MTEKIILGVAPVVRGRWRIDHLAEVEQAPAVQPADAPAAIPTDEERSPDEVPSAPLV
jgi:hypothetical protein